MVLYEVLYDVLYEVLYEALYEVPRLTTYSSICVSWAQPRNGKSRKNTTRSLDGSSLAQAPHPRTAGGLAQWLLWASSCLSCVQGEARAGAALRLPEG